MKCQSCTYFIVLCCSFDYGDKFWLLKNRYFTCKCCSNLCRYGHSQRTAATSSEDIGDNDNDNDDDIDEDAVDADEVEEEEGGGEHTEEDISSATADARV